MRKSLNRSLIVLLLLGISLPGFNAIGMSNLVVQTVDEVSADNPTSIESFDLISPTEGWILIKQRLFWTNTSGRSWTEITPPRLGNPTFRSVFFIDSTHGWVISDEFDQNGTVHYTLARTSNGGKLWKLEDVPFFSPGDVDSILQAAFLTFVDRNTGWLVIRTASSSNFSNGVLFRTDDGGNHWSRFELPIGEPVYFIDEKVGWIAGGPAGDELYRTDNGGETWQIQSILPPTQFGNQSINYQNPIFSSSLIGFLPVVLSNQEGSQLELYYSEDEGLTWKLENTKQVEEVIDPSVFLPFAVLDGQDALIGIPENGEIFRITRYPSFTTMAVEQNILPAIQELDMASRLIGWAKQVTGVCIPGKGTNNQPLINRTKICTVDNNLLLTLNGGQNWQPLALPIPATSRLESTTELPAIGQNPNATLAPSIAGVGTRARQFVGQGFDKCEIPTYDKLQNWIKNSPYDVVNLYIGGVARSCSNLALTATYISQLNQEGWKFIPTWVGHQAPCFSKPATKMSSNPVVARQQGIDNANAAIDKAVSLGLSLADQTGAVIYFDLESYNILNTTCHTAAKAFIEGWSSQMRSRGNIPGVYSSGPPLSEFFNLAEKPDVIWPAHWVTTNYDPNASVWNVYFLLNSYWANHERLRQYAGGHSETWGLLPIVIDSDVLDGLVALGPLEGDYNNDGYSDLYSVQKNGGSSGKTEVYLLDGKTSFSSQLAHLITPLPETNSQWVFELADYDNDGKQDLFAIQQEGTFSGKTEVQVLSGMSGFQTILLNTPTALSQTIPSAWVYQLGDYDRNGIPDLYAINRNTGASGFTEITVLSGSDGFQTVLLSTPTTLGKTGSGGDWAFALADYNQDNYTDLFAIDKANGISSRTELHILNGAEDFHSLLLDIPTALMKTGTDNGWAFFLRNHNEDNIPDLYAVNKASGASGRTEIIILDGASLYQNTILNAVSGLARTGSDCKWDFLTGQCSVSSQAVRFWYFFPLLFR